MYNNKGFTLIEIVIVIALIGILIAIVIPGFKTWQEAHRVTSAAQGIRAALQFAKATAIRSQSKVTVDFTAGTGNAGDYTVFIDDNADGVQDAGEQVVKSETMHQSITLYTPSFMGSTFTQFNSMGFPSGILSGAGGIQGGSGTVCVRNNTNTLFKRVNLSNTGNIKIEKSSTGPNGPWVD